ncbi:MAG: homoserine kinase [Dehalococcoidia bacterium]
MFQRAVVSIPATSANLGPGFDCLGVALDLRGTVELIVSDSQSTQAENRGEAMALNAARQVFRQLGLTAPNLQVKLSGDVPPGRGLGASAIVHVGAILAAAALAGVEPDRERLLQLAAELEGHADNAAPAMLGGLQVVVWDGDVLWHVPVSLPEGLRAVLCIPEFEMPTEESRRLLPDALSRREVVHNVGRAALLVAGFAAGRLDVLSTATHDVLHQPARSKLFPAMYEIFEAAEDAGALGVYLSGGGSTILALAQHDEVAISAAMDATGRAHAVSSRSLIVDLSDRGAEIVSVT